jgi:Tol biopolymer transport system component
MPEDIRAEAEAVRAQIVKITASSGFAKSERISRFLRFIVEETLAGRGDNIKEYVIGTEVYARPADYDPRIDAIVRVQAAKLRKRLDLYYGSEGSEDELFIRIPKGGYRPEFELRNGGRALAPTISAGPRRQGLAASLAVLLVLFAAGGWWFARLGTRAPQLAHQRLISTFEGSHHGASFSPDGSMIAFVGMGTDSERESVSQVWVKELSEGRPIQVTFGGTDAIRPVWSPHGDQIVFERTGQGIWSVPPLGGTAHRVVEDGHHASLSADGSHLLFVRQRAIWIAGADGSAPRRLEGVPERFFPMQTPPAFSPDGRAIAFFNAEVGPLGDIWVISVEGGSPRQLTFDHVETRGLTWSHDGTWIIFSSARAGSFTLWRVAAAGSGPQPITTGTGEDTEPAFSPRGSELIYTNTRTSWGLMLLDPANGKQKEVLAERETIGFPTFSRDGQRIAYFQPVDGNPHLFLVDADGGNRQQLTRGKGQEILPAWSNDGSLVYFYEVKPELSFRKLALPGGKNMPVATWAYGKENWASVDPFAHAAAYTVVGPKGPLSTLVRELATGQERPLAATLTRLQWSPDGRYIMGESGNRGAGDGQVTICAAQENNCREITGGLTPKWSADGRSIYFLRRSDRPEWFDLWFASRDGADPRRITTIGPFRADLINFDVSLEGRIIWAPSHEGRQELWLASLD